MNTPRQSIFVNSTEALKQTIERINTVLIKNLIVENKNLTGLDYKEDFPSAISRLYDTSVDTQVGDIISVTAEIEEYYSMTELVNVSSYSVISSDNNVSSTLISASDLGIECSMSGEQYESMLVEIRNVSFDSVDEFGNWTVSDNSGMVMVDDYHFDGTFPSISAGDSFDCVTGVVAYSYGEFKIYPRNTDDFSCSGCLSNGDVNSDTNVEIKSDNITYDKKIEKINPEEYDALSDRIIL